jgi:hypothetical protein
MIFKYLSRNLSPFSCHIFFPMLSDWTLRLGLIPAELGLELGRHNSKFTALHSPQALLSHPRADVASKVGTCTVYLALHRCLNGRHLSTLTVEPALLMLSKPTTTSDEHLISTFGICRKQDVHLPHVMLQHCVLLLQPLLYSVEEMEYHTRNVGKHLIASGYSVPVISLYGPPRGHRSTTDVPRPQ